MNTDLQKVAIISGQRQVTFNDMLLRTQLYAQCIPSGVGDKVIVFSENREGWAYAFFSIWMNGCIAVPVDAGSTAHDVAYILNDCRPQCIWASSKTEHTVREALAEAGLEIDIRIIDELEEAPVTGTYAGELPWHKIHEDGNQETALIIYTSGTTGMPKGVMLSNTNIRKNLDGVSVDVPIFNADRRTMILLPLHHVLPLLGSLVFPMCCGGGVAICPTLSGPDLMQTMVNGKVAIVIGVPRLYQTLYSGIKKKIDASVVTRTLYNICERVGSRSLSRAIFGSLRKKMGGHITYFVSGGAALDSEIGRGMRTLGLDVLEGYGMTEAAPMIAFTRPDDIKPGCSGLPLPGVECKLVNGELLARGANIMQGYYNRPEETAQVLDSEGFLHTGDLATIDPQGHITITGRTKEIIVLSNGKNVQPNEIEFKLEKYDQYVKEAAVVQDVDLLRAIIVPQKEWAQGLSDAEVELVLKREVLEPYNMTVSNYKKLMSLMVYRGDLPRTKMEKLQRFKLKDILAGKAQAEAQQPQEEEPQMEEYQILKRYIEDEKKVKVKPTSHIETDLAMDSLDKVGLQGFVEHSFGVHLKAEEMAGFASVLAMAEHIAKTKTHTDVEEVDWSTLLYFDNTTLQLPTPSWMYTFGERVLTLMFRIWNRLSISGDANIPMMGPYILAPNHQSFVDGPVALSGLSQDAQRQIYTYATEDHMHGKLRRFLASRSNVIIMERANLKDSILKMAEVLKQGSSILIFPEGHRTHDGEVDTFKKTFAILSKELNVPVIPVRITGAYEALSRHDKFLKPHRIEVEYLTPMLPTADQDYDDFAAAVQQAIKG